MIYGAYHTFQQAVQPLNLYAKAIGAIAGLDCFPLNRSYVNRHIRAGAEFVERLTRRYENPGFTIDHTFIDGQTVPVQERVVRSTAFCDLVHFNRTGIYNDPAVLMVAPMAGHYASLIDTGIAFYHINPFILAQSP